MSTHYTLVSHGKVLGHTGALFPADELPSGACIWHFVPLPAFDFVEPIIAEMTAPPAFELVHDVIPTQDEYLHAFRDDDPTRMEALLAEAARLHHFREVLERYEALDLELRDGNGRQLSTATLTLAKQVIPAIAVRELAEASDPSEAGFVRMDEPCYVLMARLQAAASAA